jgi:hypothetical protein
MPVDARGFRTLRASGVQNPRHDAGRKSKTGQPQAPYSGRRRLRAPERRPAGRLRPRRRRRGAQLHGIGATYASARTVVVAARAASQSSYRRENRSARLPAPRLTQTSGSRSGDPHGVIGEWQIHPLPRYPPSRQVRPPALDFHRSRSARDRIADPRDARCSSQAGVGRTSSARRSRRATQQRWKREQSLTRNWAVPAEPAPRLPADLARTGAPRR